MGGPVGSKGVEWKRSEEAASKADDGGLVGLDFHPPRERRERGCVHEPLSIKRR